MSIKSIFKGIVGIGICIGSAYLVNLFMAPDLSIVDNIETETQENSLLYGILAKEIENNKEKIKELEEENKQLKEKIKDQEEVNDFRESLFEGLTHRAFKWTEANEKKIDKLKTLFSNLEPKILEEVEKKLNKIIFEPANENAKNIYEYIQRLATDCWNNKDECNIPSIK